MINQIEALSRFVAARMAQQKLHNQDAAEVKAAQTRQHKMSQILDLVSKYGGDFTKASRAYVEAKQDFSALSSMHPEVHNSKWFTEREDALHNLSQIMGENLTMNEWFNDLFMETAIQAMYRSFSNGRGFFFLAPFIGGVVLNRISELHWLQASLEELDSAVTAEIAKENEWDTICELIRKCNDEAHNCNGPFPVRFNGRKLSYAEDMWGIISDHTLEHAWWTVNDIISLTEYHPGDRETGLWAGWKSGERKATNVLMVWLGHPEIGVMVRAHIKKWGLKVPTYDDGRLAQWLNN